MYLSYFLYFTLLGSNFLLNKVEGSKAEKIIGGKLANAFQFKYVVAVMYKEGESNHTHQNPCTGTIIDDLYIITVAHCFYNKRTGGYIHREFYIAFSIIDLLNPLVKTQYINVDLVFIHPYYTAFGPDDHSKEGNLAVVQLASNLGLHQGHRTLKRLRTSRNRFRSSTDNFVVAAYGWNELDLLTDVDNGVINYVQVGKSDHKLRYAEVKIYNYDACKKIIKKNITAGIMCAKIIQDVNERKGICQNDSGAPLASNRFLYGIAINGFKECNENKLPGIYIDIGPYNNFIDSVLDGFFTNEMQILQQTKNADNEFRFKKINNLFEIKLNAISKLST